MRFFEAPSDCNLQGINPLIGTLKPQSNGPLYSNTVISTLAVDGSAVTLVQRGGAWAGYGPAQSSPRCTKCNKPSTMWHYYYLCTLKNYSRHDLPDVNHKLYKQSIAVTCLYEFLKQLNS